MRKLAIVQTLLEKEIDNFKFGCMEFDGSGQYLAVGSLGGVVKLFNTKTWECFTKFESHKDSVTSLRFDLVFLVFGLQFTWPCAAKSGALFR